MTKVEDKVDHAIYNFSEVCNAPGHLSRKNYTMKLHCPISQYHI